MTKISRPLIAVTTDKKEIDNYQWHATPDQYIAAAIDAAAVTPVLVPNIGEMIDYDALFSGVNGLMITGSRSNIHPSLYSDEPEAGHEPFDRARDNTTLPLIRAAIERGIPMLAICRGLQELNVALGGTLANDIQELSGRADHRAPQADTLAERFAIRHPLHIAVNSCLAQIIDSETIQINSVHRQAIDRLADQLDIEATAEDGTIEAVYVKGAKAFALGVQWHPEFWAKTDSPSRKILSAFGDAVRANAKQRG